ncbi:hypothetical protein GYMLUDRAFT_264073 [Collybiopsis luxurians FD-317 M1]|uniref:NmrA-like domain-containing protein n=1 Tax=Collybiopsis luxurians FD-317 M1 TaxID=944289 RepID=A0A0D0CBW4_9AGAR|nr:hypothetical protein GYMLUDRAFT_264073 [Collybiopsis luxurians FD-317 M1]
MSSADKKRLLVIGATGTQGKVVVAALLAPQDDGTPSPYSVRALTRDPKTEKAQAVEALGAELFEGHFDNLSDIASALEGCYGVFVNTDTFTVGEKNEIYAAVKIFEQAHRAQLKHFIWSGLDYASKLGNFNPKYHTIHYDGKGTFGDFLQVQPSSPNGDSLTWTIITTGPYLENLEDTSRASPTATQRCCRLGDSDRRWSHPRNQSRRHWLIATEFMTIDQLVETFTRVTGIPAVHERISVEEYLGVHEDYFKLPMVRGRPEGPSIRDTVAGMYRIWGDDLLTRDMEWIRRVHPTGYTLESFIRKKKINGTIFPSVAYKYQPTQ